MLFFAGESATTSSRRSNAAHPAQEINRRLLEVFVANIASNLNNVELFSACTTQAYQDPLLRIPCSRLAFMHAVGEALAERAREHDRGAIDITISRTSTMLSAIATRHAAQGGRDAPDRQPAGTRSRAWRPTLSACSGDGIAVTPQTLLPIFFSPFIGEAAEQRLSATIGLVRLSELDGNASDVIKSANIALNLAKRHRRAREGATPSAAWSRKRARACLLRELRTAFDQRWLQVDYQPTGLPQYAPPDRRQALLRWPARPAGRRAGAVHTAAGAVCTIVALGKWVLRTARQDSASCSRSAPTCACQSMCRSSSSAIRSSSTG